MSKTIMILGAAAILSMGSLVSAQAGGGGTSAPSKYNAAIYAASVDREWQSQRLNATGYTITEFSSSSARASGPRR